MPRHGLQGQKVFQKNQKLTACVFSDVRESESKDQDKVIHRFAPINGIEGRQKPLDLLDGWIEPAKNAPEAPAV